MNIKEISEVIYKNNHEKGFWDERLGIPKKMIECGLFSREECEFVWKAIKAQMLMLIVSEISEAMEADRSDETARVPEETKQFIQGLEGDEFKTAFEKRIKNTFNDELADAVIRIFDVTCGGEIDLEWHIAQKVKYNKMRPHKHGKKY